jgi:hypothetical protein
MNDSLARAHARPPVLELEVEALFHEVTELVILAERWSRFPLARDLEKSARTVRTPMTGDELLAHFPEVPRDLRDEPILTE